MVELAEPVELVVDRHEGVYAAYDVGGHREVRAVASCSFKRWLINEFYWMEGKAPSQQAVAAAVNTIAAKGHHTGPKVDVFHRIGKLGDTVYLDLCDSDWRAIEVTRHGWRSVERPPVYFRRARGMEPLPSPQLGGTCDLLADFLNVNSYDDFKLATAWLVGSLNPTGPYPILVLGGEQGSAKSTTARSLRSLVDPNSSPLRTVPRDERDLMIAANNGWILSFDNLGRLPAWLSDALCRIATGGGFATRELYSDKDEVLFDAMRPIVLNSIGDPIERDDLRDRALFITLPPIHDSDRRDERGYWRDFHQAQPQILGALLDAVSCALSHREETSLPFCPRLADFAIWVSAAEPSLDWPSGSFLAAYRDNRQGAIEAAVEDSLIARHVIEIAKEHRTWSGTATELLADLNERADEQMQRSRGWPKSPRQLGGDLRRLAASLRRVGVDVAFEKEKTARRRRLITITRRESSETAVQTVQKPGRTVLDGLDINLQKT
jgi:hypothetical protein